jgi:CRP-like cAMP-binding protein
MDQSVANGLLASLSPALRRRVLDRCDYIDVSQETGLQLPRARAATVHSYFPTNSVVSLLAPSEGSHPLEVLAVGREGMFGAPFFTDGRHVELQAMVQAAGHAWRIRSGPLEQLVTASPQLHATLQRYLRVVLAQTARQATCCRFHSVSQRLARWLLTHADCAGTRDVLVTHNMLAQLLGAQRAGVTVAAGTFERKGLISTARGHIVVVDRGGLVDSSCPCYAMNRASYRAGMGMPALLAS